MIKSFHRSIPGHPVEEQIAFTETLVRDDHDIWIHGRGLETIHELMSSFRRRQPGEHTLYLGMDCRVLADNAADINFIIESLDNLSVTIKDLSNPEDRTTLALFRRAQKGLRWNGDRRQQRRKGARGGVAKGRAAQAARVAEASEEVIQRMIAHSKLTLQDCVDIFGPKFSLSSLRRNFIDSVNTNRK